MSSQFSLSDNINKQPHFVALNHLDNGLGEVILTLLGRDGMIDPNEVLGGFYLKGIRPGQTDVSVETSILLSKDGKEISHGVSSLSIIIEQVSKDIEEYTIDPDSNPISIGVEESTELLRKNISREDTYIEFGDTLRLFIPARTFDDDIEIHIMTLPPLDESLSNVYDITATSPLYGRVKIYLRADDLNLEKHYGIYHYNEDREKWIYQGGPIEDGYVSAWVSHFGRFTVLEDRNYIEFKDIENNWAREYIQFLNFMGIISGLPDKSFNPSGNMTRAEAVKVLSLAMDFNDIKLKSGEINAIPFTDYDSIPSWSYSSVQSLYMRGIIGGYKDNSFRPNNNVTRAEIATMISRALQDYISIDEDFKYIAFSDDEDIPSWANKDIYLIKALGIVTGYDDGSFRPNINVTRAEACKIIYETLKVLNVI